MDKSLGDVIVDKAISIIHEHTPSNNLNDISPECKEAIKNYLIDVIAVAASVFSRG